MKVRKIDLEAARASGVHLSQLARDIGCSRGAVQRAEEKYGVTILRLPHGVLRPIGFSGFRQAVQDMAPLDAVNFLLDVLGNLVGALPDGRADIGWPDVHLAPGERAILQILFRHEGRVVSRDAIMDALYGHSPDAPEAKILNVFVCRLRPKVAGRGVTIATTYGVGWTLTRDQGVVFPWEHGA